MKENIVILSILKFEREGVEKSRLTFIFADKDRMSISKKMKGYIDLSLYYEDTKPFDNIPSEIIGEVVQANLIEKPNKNNPLKKTSIIDSVIFNGQTYDLC